MGVSKQTKEVPVTYEGKRRQINSRGISKPKGRVKNYRVEIRLNSKQKIWVGSFKTMSKAMRAYDAAVYMIGKQPYYHIYPSNYFPMRHSQPSFEKLKTTVKTEAKEYAEKNDPVQVNPLSLVPDTSTRAPQGLNISESIGSHRSTSMDRQVIFPVTENLTNIMEEAEVDAQLLKPIELEEFDEFIRLSTHHGHLPSSSLTSFEDLWVQESVNDDEGKVPAAYLRGLNAPNPSVIDNALLDDSLPGSFNVFPHIQGGDISILDGFLMGGSPLLKRERESSSDALEDHFASTPVSICCDVSPVPLMGNWWKPMMIIQCLGLVEPVIDALFWSVAISFHQIYVHDSYITKSSSYDSCGLVVS